MCMLLYKEIKFKLTFLVANHSEMVVPAMFLLRKISFMTTGYGVVLFSFTFLIAWRLVVYGG